MSDHTEDRIQLAEMMGWMPTSIYTSVSGVHDVTVWASPNGERNRMAEDLPDPFTDANDCEALINHLQTEFLIAVTVKFGKGVRFDHYSGPRREIEIGDWKQGVCELALKVNEQWIKTF